MPSKKRQDRIARTLEYVRSAGGASIRDLAAALGVSEMTVRRDLDLLAADGKLRLVHTGAVPYEAASEGASTGLSLSDVRSPGSHEKMRIGQKAASLVEAGDVIIIDAGATTEWLTRSIPPDLPVTILCFALNIALEAGRHPAHHVVLAGGALKAQTLVCESPEGVGLTPGFGTSERRSFFTLAIAMVLFPVGWEMRELVRFDKAYLERDDVKTIARYLDEHDRQLVVYTNSIIDAPFRFYFQRHGLGVPGLGLDSISVILEQFFNDNGDAQPVHFLQFTNVEKTAFDKGLYALFAKDKAWTWVADPYGHRAEWEDAVRRKDSDTVRAFEEIGSVVVDVGRMRVIRVTRADLDAQKLKRIAGKDGSFVDLGEASSSSNKFRGFRYAEKYDGPGFSWTVQRQAKHYRFTMQGLKQDPVGSPVREAVVVTHVSAASRLTFRGLTSVAEQHVEVLINGKPLGTVDVPQDWKSMRGASRPTRSIRAAFSTSRSDEPVQRLRLRDRDPVDPPDAVTPS